MIDGFGGKYVEAHALDAKTAKKIPRRMIDDEAANEGGLSPFQFSRDGIREWHRGYFARILVFDHHRLRHVGAVC